MGLKNAKHICHRIWHRIPPPPEMDGWDGWDGWGDKHIVTSYSVREISPEMKLNRVVARAACV